MSKQNYVEKLSSKKLGVISIIIDSMKKHGVTNKFTQSAILAIISKESNFVCAFEIGYGGTSNERIRRVFYSKVKHLSDDELTRIKANSVDFFNTVYGGRYGNASDEGYKYRGGGFNQITFKANYESAAKQTGHDLVGHPELIENPKVAADAAVAYFVSRFKRSFKARHQEHYNSKDINGFKDIENATLAVYHANAGFGKPVYTVAKANKSIGGLKKSIVRAPQFLEYLSDTLPFTKKKEGDHFREWVNNYHREYAKSISLDRSGSFNNSFIREAWEKLGDEYNKTHRL